MKDEERIDHFLCGDKRAERSFLTMDDSYLAVEFTQSKVLHVLEKQDNWCLKQRAKKEEEEQKRAKD